MNRIITIAVAALLAGPAFAQASKDAVKEPAPHTVDLRKYVDDAASADLFEVKASQLALQRSQDPAIREFAQHMVSEHTDSTNKLKVELDKAKVEVQPPTTLPPEKQAMLDKLMNIGMEDFNKMYMRMQIAGHEEALALHSAFAKSGTDNFRIFARTMTTHVKDHLATAKRIDSALPEGTK
jgi:putative membrane protein